ncbi:hypothetical protein [Sphingomonas sp. IC4-52]|uniref:hypothetical protein n=1 Tax=Sphingomonas sp. IC4-52 TaxID=2887202 RepID=UPI001D0FD197|nr:hypothetical protein [Sphingomonas sp. IC4-52]MCC2981036.1 hypothetical protein [Sphingomonas sp. IC4-52]
MNAVLRALAGLALIIPAAAGARPLEVTPAKAKATATQAKAATKKAPARKASAKKAGAKKTAKGAATKAAESAPEPVIVQTADTNRVARWVGSSGDNQKLPYAIIDKNDASLSLYSASGKLLDKVPVLIGIARGDEATAGVGTKKLSEIGPAEKTTPAGRYLAKFGLAFGRERVLWVDYATSVAIHTIPADSSKKERRRERMLSETPEDNRVTFGCINVPKAFYAQLLRPQFQKKGGYVYVLPDSKPIEEVFPRLRVEAVKEASLTAH